jgi:inner membrane protein
VWLIALLSLVLPIVGVMLALYGAFQGFSGHAIGWLWLVIGIGVLIVDLVIDERWSYGMKSAEPDLNRRGDQLVGEIVTVVEPIEAGGRGSVRVSDTLWPAEGATAVTGAKVRVSGCKGTVLTVEAV